MLYAAEQLVRSTCVPHGIAAQGTKTRDFSLNSQIDRIAHRRFGK